MKTICKSMGKIQFLSNKKGKSHIVWLQKSNKYISLKNPVFDVFKLIAQDSVHDEISAFLFKKYDLSIEKSQYLIDSVVKEIERINIPENVKDEPLIHAECSNYTTIPHSTRVYKFGEKVFSISYEDKNLEDWLKQLIAHLETGNHEIPSFHFELFNYEGNIVFRESGFKPGIISENSSIHKVDKFFTHLTNRLFDKSVSDCLMTVHASAITNQKKTILFSASSGGGKTTLAAFLLQKGLNLVSDDLVLIDRQKRAYGFPSAMSIKQGAYETLLPIYPELAVKEEIQVSPEKKVRYLNVNQYRENASETYPVHEVIFVQYNPRIDLKLTKMSCVKGIKAFLEQTYITPDPQCAKIFMDWALNASFYRLSYSNTDLAINELTKLFQHE
jgi:hypothetical protein